MIAVLREDVRRCQLASNSRSAASSRHPSDRPRPQFPRTLFPKQLASNEFRLQFSPLAASRFRPGIAGRHLAPVDRGAAGADDSLQSGQRASVGSTEAPEMYFRGSMPFCPRVTLEA